MQTLPRRPLHWTWRLPVAPEVVLPALQTAIGGDVRSLASEPTRLVLTCSPGDVSLRFAVDVRASDEGAEIVVSPDGHQTAAINKRVVLLALFVLYMGVVMCASRPLALGLMLVATAVSALVGLALDRRAALRQRHVEFTRVVAALDRAVHPLKARDERPYRALAGTDLEAPRPRRAGSRRGRPV